MSCAVWQAATRRHARQSRPSRCWPCTRPCSRQRCVVQQSSSSSTSPAQPLLWSRRGPLLCTEPYLIFTGYRQNPTAIKPYSDKTPHDNTSLWQNPHATKTPGPVFIPALLNPDDPGESGKPGEVIRGSGDGSPPAGTKGRAPGGGGQPPPPETGVWGLASRSWTGFNDYKDIFGWNFSNKIRHIQNSE